ncbi:MAG: hypothetical protein RLZZ450_5613 [Pseudomonadota bacterium]|jgi:uncharacterized membrane protein YdjX (TVP38/TMEM64 family)
MTSKPSHKARIVIVLSLLALAPFIAQASGLTTNLSVAHLRELVGQAGAWGALLFFVVFVGAVVAQVPGVPFVALAPTLFRLPEAWALCFVASNVAMLINFALVRRLGGQPLGQLQSPRLKRLLAQLDTNPVRTVALLRTLTVMFPPVTSALALTSVSSRDHAIGSALGMLVPVTAILLITAAVVHAVP